MAQSYKICPICSTPNHPNAAICSTCGTTLANVEVINAGGTTSAARQQAAGYDHHYGEADLFEDELRGRGETLFVALTLLVVIGLCGGLTLAFGSQVMSALPTFSFGADETIPTLTLVPTGARAQNPLPLITNTPRPTLQLATITPAPPTATVTPTQGPCLREVQAGDDLITLAYSCGHRSLDIVPTILELNDLDAPENMQVGQTLEIPWPTPTIDPARIPTEDPDDTAFGVPTREGTLAPAEEALISSAAIATETLQPGIAWHRVQPNENAVSIAARYGADIEILSQLNPEITFSQCDFGEFGGGPTCIVQLYIGQLMRVPAPTATPTIQPTPSGSETATPSMTPTFNAPSLSQPPNRGLFTADELITLRWVPTGTLAEGQVYRVRVEDETIDTVYTADTFNIFFIVPEAWQGDEQPRHEYNWSVSIYDTDRDEAIFTTETRRFSWGGRGVTQVEAQADEE